jgi:GNAT superfamily N-acetyltransferase
LARGLELDDDPVAIAMALRRAPPSPPPGLEARRVTTLEEYAAAHEVQLAAFGETGSARGAQQRALLADEWREGPKLMHAVWLHEEMVGSGSCARTPHGLALFGGATLPGARGRGVYRTLLAARWEEAEQLGAPALVTQAGAMSGPILERAGFEAVGRVEMLIDEFDAREPGCRRDVALARAQA